MPIYILRNDDYYSPVVWTPKRTQVYLDEIQDKLKQLDKIDAQIRVITQKYANYQKARKPKMFNQKQIEYIKIRRKQGTSLRKIAKEMNCSEGTIRNYLKNE